MSAALTHSGPRVSAEFRGLARVFRAEVRATDVRFESALADILAPLRERLKRHPRLRPEQPKIAVLAYRRTVPTEFRLRGPLTTPDRDSFQVSETRLISTWFNSAAWGDDDLREPGVTLADYVLKLDRGRLRTNWTPVAVVSAHALGRRLERGHDRSHAALVADLAVLMDARPHWDHVQTGHGCWMGGRVFMESKHGVITAARSIRTWHR